MVGHVRMRSMLVAALVAVGALATLGAGGASAAAGDPSVVFGSNASTSDSTAQLGGAPDSELDTDGGLLAETRATASTDGDDGPAEATATQRTAVRHSPANVTGGYEMRRVTASSHVDGSADRTNALSPAANVQAVASSVSQFTINRGAPMQFSFSDLLAQTDDANDCSFARVQIKRGAETVYSRNVQTAGCPAGPVNKQLPAGGLVPGTYTLITTAEGETTPSNDRVSVSSMSANVTATLTFGTGRMCRNILPGSAGATILGTSGNDLLCGRSGPDVIKGFAGDDVLYGQGDADQLLGGVGQDGLIGGNGGDTLAGGDGPDSLRPGDGSDTASGNDGNDIVRGCDDRRDTLRGAAGTDRVYRDPGDTISGFENVSTC